ncbi:MAG: patatin-like phospholipase family protein [Acidimicrobiales bacterium]|nr:patatin-like phospholipase family protein [Acidimicrobiales bacterium]
MPNTGLPSAAEVIHQRLVDGSTPGNRQDDFRLALAIEGGGMRGVVSAGMLVALEQLGMTGTVDMVVGTSAGALAGAFFVDGRAVEGSVLFYTELHQEPFLDRSRLLKREAALNLHYLVEEAAVDRGLDVTALVANPIPLYATVAPVDPTSDVRHFEVNGSSERVNAILKATASLPVLAGSAKEVDGDEYLDGGLHEQIPWRTAARLGATHVLVLPSQPVTPDLELDTLSFVERVSVVPVVKRVHNDHIGDLVASLPERSSREAWNLRAVSEGRATPLERMPGHGQPRFDIVHVDESVELPGRLERDRRVLVDALIAGANAVVDHFGLGGPDAVAVEQRVVLTHPAAPVKHFRASQLIELVIERGAGGQDGDPENRRRDRRRSGGRRTEDGDD